MLELDFTQLCYSSISLVFCLRKPVGQHVVPQARQKMTSCQRKFSVNNKTSVLGYIHIILLVYHCLMYSTCTLMHLVRFMCAVKKSTMVYCVRGYWLTQLVAIVTNRIVHEVRKGYLLVMDIIYHPWEN